MICNTCMIMLYCYIDYSCILFCMTFIFLLRYITHWHIHTIFIWTDTLTDWIWRSNNWFNWKRIIFHCISFRLFFYKYLVYDSNMIMNNKAHHCNTNFFWHLLIWFENIYCTTLQLTIYRDYVIEQRIIPISRYVI